MNTAGHFHPHRRARGPQGVPLANKIPRNHIRNAIDYLIAADEALDRLNIMGGNIENVRQPLRNAGARLLRAVSLLGLLLLIYRPVRAQVAADVTLSRGEGSTVVWNSGRDSVHYGIELLARAVLPRDSIVLGRVVQARISPASFTLGPGERQTVRVRLREASPTPTLGFAVTMTPRQPTMISVSGPGITTHLAVILRYVARVTLE